MVIEKFPNLNRRNRYTPLSDNSDLISIGIWNKSVGALTPGNVRKLVDARQRLLEGETGAAQEIQEILGILTALYPAHIEKEDRHFFLPVMDYFTKKEQLDMLHRFWEFDEKLIHHVYGDIVLHHEKISSGS